MRPRPQRKIGIQQDGAATALIGSDAVQKNIHPFLSHPVQSVLKFFYLIFSVSLVPVSYSVQVKDSPNVAYRIE